VCNNTNTHINYYCSSSSRYHSSGFFSSFANNPLLALQSCSICLTSSAPSVCTGATKQLAAFTISAEMLQCYNCCCNNKQDGIKAKLRRGIAVADNYSLQSRVAPCEVCSVMMQQAHTVVVQVYTHVHF
jgi:hypothetical protein